MLSLTRAMNRMDREERLYKAALGCYLAAIAAMQEYPLETEPEASRAYRTALREIDVYKRQAWRSGASFPTPPFWSARLRACWRIRARIS